MRSHLICAATAAAVLGLSSHAVAQQTINLTVGASHPVAFPAVTPIKNYVVPEINRRLAKTGKYKINWREAYGGQLFKANASLTALRDGIADMGWVFVLFEGARMPLAQVSSFTPGVTEDHRLMMKVHNELMTSYGPLKAEWTKYKLAFLSAMAIDSVQLFTKFPVKSYTDIKGKKLSSAGTVGAWVSALGAVPVNDPLPAFYNAIKTGLSDGAMTAPTAVMSIKLFEVTPHVTILRMGSFYGGALAMNADSLAKLPPEVQKVIREVAAQYSDKVGDRLDFVNKIAFGLFRKKGPKMNPPITVSTMPDAERKKMFAGMKNIAQAWAAGVEAKGAPARQVLKVYMDTMRKHGAKPVRDWDKN